MKGLELAFNLKELFLPNQEISDLKPISGLYSLTFLALNHNQIRDVCPLAGLYKLQKLVISDNQVEDIGRLSRMSSLTDLLISNNHLTSVAPLAKLNIGWLDVAKNPIEDITAVSTMKKLHHLYVDQDALNEQSKSLVSLLEQSGVAVNRAQAATKSNSGISIFVQDDRVLFERAPIVIEGTTLVQFRPLFNKLGFNIRWDESTRTILADKPGTQLSMQVDNTTATLNGAPVTLNVAPRNVDGSIMVPVRFVSEASKLEATWDSKTKTVYLLPERTLTAPNGLFRFKVNGKWIDKTSTMGGKYGIYLENGSSILAMFAERKSDLGDKMNLDDYETAIKKSLEPLKITPSSESKSLIVHGMNAKQISYSLDAGNGAKYEYVLTIVEGQYNFFRIVLGNMKSFSSETLEDYRNILQSFEELKTAEQLSEEKFGKLKPIERVLEAAQYYRNIGFFAGDKSLSNQQFEEKFKKFYSDFRGEDWDPFDSSEYYDALAEFYVLGEDKQRVWLEDTEADVGSGNEVYVKTLKEWSSISRGAFQPSEIKESWKTEEGPIEVSFTLNGTERTIHPEYLNDFIDTGVLAEINEMIKDSGYQFVLVEIDQTVFVTVLNDSEREQIQKERYWPMN
ncbi:hypothetical protein LJK87_44430 [Paenibacillus sp. P25]|nr:hypothetical protein LJK87_44430 [Paenibacillus sp. P25]